ncbi:MAG: RnfABCDGE type electron transport complex subunit G [Bacteroidales bacterium]|nr:RnfABCDGE type electron transport complex subunit G [Bacteroidales bacterium]
MAKKESTLINMLIALFVITFVSSTSLGLVYQVTKEPIAAAKLAKKIEAIQNVVPKFNNQPNAEEYKVATENGDSLTLYPAKKDGELVGTAVESSTNLGFSGEIKLMVGFLPDGTIKDVAVLEHKETPGLGDKMERKKSDWSIQFQGKNPASFKIAVKNDGGEVDAITASTISSRAFCDAVERAYIIYMKGVKK